MAVEFLTDEQAVGYGRFEGKPSRAELERLFFLDDDLLMATRLIAPARRASNAGIAARLYLSPKSVERNVAAVFDKLGLPPDTDHNRRVLAVIAFLRAPA